MSIASSNASTQKLASRQFERRFASTNRLYQSYDCNEVHKAAWKAYVRDVRAPDVQWLDDVQASEQVWELYVFGVAFGRIGPRLISSRL
jgi:hypothetical protein